MEGEDCRRSIWAACASEWEQNGHRWSDLVSSDGQESSSASDICREVSFDDYCLREVEAEGDGEALRRQVTPARNVSRRFKESLHDDLHKWCVSRGWTSMPKKLLVYLHHGERSHDCQIARAANDAGCDLKCFESSEQLAIWLSAQSVGTVRVVLFVDCQAVSGLAEIREVCSSSIGNLVEEVVIWADGLEM
mmetsp:Transcript_96410/g.276929  ORF Transcript_96410/g.276929 Transcript_96410/m.276929 type:complete len:192 (-) Transcript_96410:214-789(-)